MSTSQEATGHSEDVVDLLVGQHEQVRGLFSLLDQGDAKERQETFEELVRLLAVHETAEEEVVYPAVRSMVDDGDDLADARTSEEAEAKEALAELEELGPDHPEFSAKLDAFKQMVLTHAGNEEREIFPRLRDTHSRDQLESMAVGVRSAESLAPTRPHPRGPESAVGNIAVGPFVAMADRVRDAIRKARR
jgi:hemerythrin superfamily protein